MNKLSHKDIVHAATKSVAGVSLYLLAVTFVMGLHTLNAQRSVLLGLFAAMLLLTLSGAVIGTLIFARPLAWHLDGRKREAAALLSWTIGLLALVFGVAVFLMA